MKLKIILITVIAGFLFTAFIYNVGTIYAEIIELLELDSNGSLVNYINLFINSYLFLYGSITIFYFFLYRLVFKRISIENDLKIALLCITTPILLDATVLIGNQSLIPLRFPFASIFPIIGVCMAILYIKSKKIAFYCCIIPVILFFYFTDQIIVPKIIYNSLSQEVSESSGDAFFENTFLTKDSILIKLKDITNNKCTLIETYFIGCGACEEKEGALIFLSNEFKNRSFKIVNICDGKISTFENFKKHLPKGNEGENYLYDVNGVLRNQLKIEAYPTELIANQKTIVSKKTGFESSITDLYLENEIVIINSILNE